ncbi:MAG: LacI family DNA-binding transcriptional regulator [Clostridiaceae bacterium]
MANLYDIAKVAGVSKSTVSRVINDQPGVKEDKRLKIQETIKKLNYKPNALARSLVLQKTHTIGIIVRELSNNFYSEYIRNLHHIADSMGYGALYCNRTSYEESNIDYLEFLNKKVDGFIFLGEGTVTKEELESLVLSKYPLVVIQSMLDVQDVTYININNYRAYYEAVEYLIKLGHRKIINISGPLDKEFVERNKGYSEAVTMHNLDYEITYYLDYFMESAYELALKIAPSIRNEKITAAVCSNNILATGFIDGLIDSGIKVPEEFSVIGFDDIVAAEVTHNNIPAITSVKQPQKDISEYAVGKLMQMMEQGIGEYSKDFSCKLKIRNSTSGNKFI